MQMRPPPFEVPESGDPFLNDKLNRKDQVEAVTNLLHNIDGSCVLAVDAPWGAGKTVFLKMLVQNLRNQDVRVAEFNAWETDFSNDPLIALFSALEPTLQLAAETNRKTVLRAGATLVSKLASSSVPFVPDVAQVITQTGEQMQTAFKKGLESHRETVGAIRDFRDALSNLGDSNLPVVVCVDELDRCRPNYAIEFLEIAKHIFDVDGITFVLTVNMTELANSVKAMYGSNFDGTTYLRRFVDHVVFLPKPDRTSFVDHLLDSVRLPHIKSTSTFARIFFNEFVLEVSCISLRDIEQAIYHLGMALRAIEPPEYGHGVPIESLVSVLMVVRIVLPQVYSKFIVGEASDLEVVNEMTRMAGRSADWWKAEEPSKLGLPHRIAIWEAIMIGWGRYTSRSSEARSPLMEQRKSESTDQDGGYPNEVINQFQGVRSTDGWKYARALALIEIFTFEPDR